LTSAALVEDLRARRDESRHAPRFASGGNTATRWQFLKAQRTPHSPLPNRAAHRVAAITLKQAGRGGLIRRGPPVVIDSLLLALQVSINP